MAHSQKSHLRLLGLATASVLTFYAGLSVYQNQNQLMRMLVSPAMRVLPAELGSQLVLIACKHRLYASMASSDEANLETELFGRSISNPIGIAAGFDRNAEAVHGLKDVGFGFIEIGSVTPLAQKSDNRKRIFRLSEDKAIVNRNAIDSDGHQTVVRRLKQLRRTKDFDGVVGVNLERNQSSKAPIKDYIQGVTTFGQVADYLVVNYCPRASQRCNKRSLIELLSAVNLARLQVKGDRRVPILLKLSPDLTPVELKEVANVIKMPACKVDGLILSHATSEPRSLGSYNRASNKKEYGLSGEPLRRRSTRMIAQMYELTNGSVPIIGVGGVLTGRDAFEKIEAGASYVQIYSAFLLEGPESVQRIKEELSGKVADRGFANVRQAVGSNYQYYLGYKNQAASKATSK